MACAGFTVPMERMAVIPNQEGATPSPAPVARRGARNLLRRPVQRWKVKALLQAGLSLFPAGHAVNFLFQKHLTRGLPLSDSQILDAASIALGHLRRVQPWLAKPVGACAFYEFGAGYDLSVALCFWALGVERQILVDIRSLAQPDCVNDVIDKLARLELPIEFARRPLRAVRPGALAADLAAHYGIVYRAPCDARETGLSDGSVDCITSTATLEHIPPPDIASILKECRRIAAPGAPMSFIIDYQDHYSFFDPTIGPYNFLRYSESEWRLFNPPLHFQNRLRHQNHLALFEEAGIAVVEERRVGGSEEDLEALSRVPIHPRFRAYRPEDLAVRGSELLLVSRGATRRPH